MKVLVTGGAGFIGSHVVEELLACDYEVVVVDNLISGFSRNLKEQVIFYEIDINDAALAYVFEMERPDYVIHLAAQVSVQASMDNPYLDFNTNTAGTVKLLSLAKKYNTKRLLFSSSSAVYGEPLYLPIDENHPARPHSYYSLSKYTAEKYIEFHGEYSGLNYCVLRLSNVFGPRQNVEGEAGVIALFIDRLMAKRELTIFDGGQTRDFVYVKDVAQAFRCALESSKVGVFNISSHTQTKINKLYEQLIEITGEQTPPHFEPLRIGEVMDSVLDNSKARHELNWRTNYSLTRGLQETVEYYSNSFSHE